MCDILVLAFQTDTTRVTTLKLNNDHSSLRFPNLGVDYMIHHLLSHTDSDDWLKVNRLFVEQLAYIARKLDGIQEGERTALDNSMIMFCSSMMTGGHDATRLPVVMVGRGGGKIKTGRTLDYADKPNRQVCRLYLSMLDKVGIPQDRFGRRQRAARGGVSVFVHRLLAAILLALLFGGAARADDALTAASLRLFDEKIHPVLAGTCFRCPRRPESGRRIARELARGFARRRRFRPGHCSWQA